MIQASQSEVKQFVQDHKSKLKSLNPNSGLSDFKDDGFIFYRVGPQILVWNAC